MPPKRPIDRDEVKAYFQATAPKWGEKYERTDIYACIYQQRKDTVLTLVDAVALPAEASTLDIGCGPGLITVALAERGFRVEAIDAVEAMVEATRALVANTGLAGRVNVSLGDAHQLSFADASFDLVLAIGVTEWLEGLQRALNEMVRVLKPGGRSIITIDNYWALHRLFDPALNPVVVALRSRIARFIRLLNTGLKTGPSRPVSRCYSIPAFQRALSAAGLLGLSSRSLGFGPFSVFRRKVLSDTLGLRINNTLQRCADSRLPLIASLGHVYIVASQKPADDGKTISLAA
jgi:ubiquinone/menaquinone biosynthesis C-methylase UbiE